MPAAAVRRRHLALPAARATRRQAHDVAAGAAAA